MDLTVLTLPSAQLKVKAAGVKQNCPLCSFQFDGAQAACGGCPMFSGCSMLKCPNCQYEFPMESKIVSWLQKIFKKRSAHA